MATKRVPLGGRRRPVVAGRRASRPDQSADEVRGPADEPVEPVPSPGPPPARPRRWRALGWLSSAVLTAVIGLVVTLNADAIKVWMSEREPVQSRVSPGARPHSWFSMVVPDPGRLPADIASVRGCDPLWRVGSVAGGVPTDDIAHRLVLRGAAKEGAVITDMRAQVTDRRPAADGALLECPAAGSDNPTVLQFDLSSGDVAVATRIAAEGSSDRVPQFGDGFVVSLKENEFVPLGLETILPEESIRWHVVADVWVGGTMRQVVLDDNGQDFWTPGRRPADQYREGHWVGVESGDWGVDRAARRGRSPGGTDQLEFGGLAVPALAGLDVYQPPPASGEPNTRYRWLRRDGRKLLTVNPAGAVPETAPAVGGRCRVPVADDDSSVPSGEVRSATTRSRVTEVHEGETVEQLTVDYRCTTREGAEFPTTMRSARLVASDTVFTSWSTEVAGSDQETVERVLAGVRSTVPLGLDAAALSAEAVAPLAPDRHPPVPDVGDITDVGYLTDVYSDARGTIVEFDVAQYSVCACPGGSVEANANPRVRRLHVRDDAVIVGWSEDAGRRERTTLSDADLTDVLARRERVVLSRTPQGEILRIGAT